MEQNNELYHHGVKGMKWGVRKTLKKTLHKRGTTRKPTLVSKKNSTKKDIEVSKVKKENRKKVKETVAKGAVFTAAMLDAVKLRRTTVDSSGYIAAQHFTNAMAYNQAFYSTIFK